MKPRSGWSLRDPFCQIGRVPDLHLHNCLSTRKRWIDQDLAMELP